MRKTPSAIAIGLSAATFLSASPVWAAGPGTDAFGNEITSSDFDPTIPTGLFSDISGTGTILVTGDDALANDVNIGFAFPFYGTTYTNLAFSTNGWISTEPFPGSSDLSNDSVLPTSVSDPGGRIYAYHDDIEAVIYGQYFSQAASQFGTEMYVAQWNACHFNCTPGSDLTVQFNTYLLRDGTIIMAYNLVSAEAGSGATVGIQNPGATDGVAYLADEGVMTDGMTIVVYSPTSTAFGHGFGGLGNDINIAANEIGTFQTRYAAGAVQDAARNAFGVAGGDNLNTGSISHTSAYGLGGGASGYSVWGRIGGFGLTGNFGPSVSGHDIALLAGIERMFGSSFLGGVAIGYNRAGLNIGALSVAGNFYTVQPYVAAKLAENWLATASLAYTYSDYSRVSNPLLTASAAGDRFAGSLSLEGRYALHSPGWWIRPNVTLTAGTERIRDWASVGGAFGGTVAGAGFFTAEATLRIEKEFAGQNGGRGTVYGLLGVDYVNTNGNDAIALFATNRRSSRVGGVAGAGFDMEMGSGIKLNANGKVTGIGSSATAFGASLQLSKSF